MSSSAADWWKGRRRRGVAAWLAIVALLLDTLLPAGFSVATPAATPVIGFCGSAPPSGGKQLPPPGAHCIYCLVVGVGPAPAAIAAPAAPLSVGIVLPLPFRHQLAERSAPFATAQPRGPPGGGIIA